MKLYFMPLSCSLATRITLTELGQSATLIEFDRLTGLGSDGSRLADLNPMARVPTLVTDAGDVVTESVAVLLHVADGTPMAPRSKPDALLQWLCFIATELHRAVFTPMFDLVASAAVKEYATSIAPRRMDRLERHLTDRDFLLDDFSVADAYLITLLHMAQATPLDLKRWPAVLSYLKRGLARPSVKSSIAIELPLFLAEQQREAAAQAS